MTTDNLTTRDSVEYRTVLVDPDLRKVLAREGTGLLPRVRIAGQAPRTRALRKAIEAAWGLRVFIVDFVVHDPFSPCVIAEVETAASLAGLQLIGLNQVPDAEFSDADRALMETLLNGSSKQEVSRIGWIDEAATWFQTNTHRRIPAKRNIEQFSAGGGCALLRFHAEDGSTFWLKAASDPHRHECAVTALLSRLGPECLPDFIASRPDWNAWLMSGEGTAFAELPQKSLDLFALLETAIASMAELQVRTIGHGEALRGCGAFDQNVHVLAAHSQELFAYLEEAMSLQASTRVPPVAKDRLREIRSIFDVVCDRLIELDLPEAIIHGDINTSNIVVHGRNCKFIDWAEAYIGNPLITLQHMLLMNRSDGPGPEAVVNRSLRDRYCAVLESACDRAAIDEALVYMPLLAAVSALYGRGDWLESASRQASRSHGYDRGLARHMDRAIRDSEFLEAIESRFRSWVNVSTTSSTPASAGVR